MKPAARLGKMTQEQKYSLNPREERKRAVAFYLDQVIPYFSTTVTPSDGSVESVVKILREIIAYETEGDLSFREKGICCYLMMGLTGQILEEMPAEHVASIRAIADESAFSHMLLSNRLVPLDEVLCPICHEIPLRKQTIHDDHWTCEICARNRQRLNQRQCSLCTRNLSSS